jgi:hypothetical protein
MGCGRNLLLEHHPNDDKLIVLFSRGRQSQLL